MMKHSFWRSAVLLFVFSAAALRAQAPKADSPGSAILIRDAQMQSKLKNMIAAKIQDDAIRVVKAGEGNLGVFLIHLNPSQPPQPPVQLMSHNDVAEVYYVLRREFATTGGPSLMGPGKDNSVENVGPGDVLMANSFLRRHWCLMEPATVLPPTIGFETCTSGFRRCDRSLSFQSGMTAIPVVVVSKRV
jgi:hypothetical protein